MAVHLSNKFVEDFAKSLHKRLQMSPLEHLQEHVRLYNELDFNDIPKVVYKLLPFIPIPLTFKQRIARYEYYVNKEIDSILYWYRRWKDEKY